MIFAILKASQFVEHINTLAHTQHAHTCTCLATYGVQDVEISQDNLLGSMCITCIFAQGTSAQGCYISLLENHDSVVTNTTGLRIERESDSLNATGCIENLQGGLYHVVVYDIEADDTVDWNSRALLLTAAMNWTFPPSEPDQLNTGKSASHATTGSIVFYLVCFPFCFNLHDCLHAGHSLLFAERLSLNTNLVNAC